MWCKHKFEETERFHASGLADRCKRVPEDNPEKFIKILFGVTTILYICKNCGKPATTEILGKTS